MRTTICPRCGRIVAQLPCRACEAKRNAESPYRSPQWRRLRAAKLAQQPTCERCGSAYRLNVHHTIGRRMTGLIVDLPELEVLCHPCHLKEEASRR